MTIKWHYQTLPGVGLLSLAGYLGHDTTGRFSGAMGWALARGHGPLLLDVSALYGWSPAGQDIVHAAALRAAEHQRPLELAGLPVSGVPLASGAGPQIRTHAALAEALDAHHIPEPHQQSALRQLRTTGWHDTPASPGP
ncbi:anti-sigma factor antagonist [Streptomyces sp. NPDC048484]|uniref:anti-sigma factor antagonist n=1 Tax=Streptomyces sp. NPDC048484 TaxID=3155146 RepID=UPI003438010B